MGPGTPFPDWNGNSFGAGGWVRNGGCMQVKVISHWKDGEKLSCSTCVELKQLLRRALDELGLKNISVEECASEEEYKSYGIIPTPILVINGKVKLSGKIPPLEMLKEFLKYENK